MPVKTLALLGLLLLATTTQAYTVERSLSLSAAGASGLQIDTRSGDLVVTGSTGSEVEVELVIEFSDRWDEADADALLEEELVFVLVEERGLLRLEAFFDRERSGSLADGVVNSLFSLAKPFPDSHLEVRVPRGLALNINDGSGAIRVSDLDGGLIIDDGSGAIEVRDIGGDLEINDGSGDMEAASVAGNVIINDGSGDMALTGIGGNVDINDGSGEIRLRQAGGSADIRDGSGDIEVSGVEGELSIDGGSGSVDIL